MIGRDGQGSAEKQVCRKLEADVREVRGVLGGLPAAMQVQVLPERQCLPIHLTLKCQACYRVFSFFRAFTMYGDECFPADLSVPVFIIMSFS